MLFSTLSAEVKNGKLLLLGSDILKFEVQNVLVREKRTKIEDYLQLCQTKIENSEDVLKLGRQIQNDCHLRARDDLHIASAIIGQARYFLSCDKKVTEMKQARCYRRLAKTYRKEYF